MNDIEIDHFLAAFEDLQHYQYCFLFPLGFVDALHLEVGLAVLHHEINTVLLVKDLEEFNHVGVVDVPQDVHLVLQCSFYVTQQVWVGVFDAGQFYLLHGERVAIVHLAE